ncbi:hypothetical protein BJ508DRAFT_332969 [Ascobolus immersus RN42]|uniref:Uncharacterized protein n=1 Tax=Ascobolus immersus RN42 TaxID=1160509 RepID=A0A3N4HLB0_ASCIM|nr:hypothetical protein BJ508DRAFT_332969 [Ascobolus immersus RN42]
MLRQTPRTRKKLRSSVKKFTEIIAISSDLVGRPASNRLHLSRLDISHLDDELGRLRVWIGNIGGERRGHGSLEYRLREAPLLYENVHKTLDDIEEDANEILDIVSGKRLPYEQQLREGPGFEVTDDDDIDGAGDLNSALGSELENHEEVAEVQERISSIESAIDDLYKTAVYIRNPNSTIRYSKALTSQSLDSKTKNLLEQYRKFDIGHTREFFKFHRQLAGTEEMDIDSIKDEALIERLGGAITRRRHQFRYWRAHRDRLSGFNSQEGESGERTSSSQFQAMEANPPKMGNDQDHEDSTGRDTPQGGAGLVFEQRGSGGPQTGSTTHVTTTDATTFRPSARPESCYSESVISYATTTRGGDAVRFPPPPDGNKEFECPYCFTICPRRYRQKGAWK